MSSTKLRLYPRRGGGARKGRSGRLGLLVLVPPEGDSIILGTVAGTLCKILKILIPRKLSFGNLIIVIIIIACHQHHRIEDDDGEEEDPWRVALVARGGVLLSGQHYYYFVLMISIIKTLSQGTLLWLMSAHRIIFHKQY